MTIKAEYSKTLRCRMLEQSSAQSQYTDKVYLPQSFLSDLLSSTGMELDGESNRLPSPLTLRLSRPGKPTFAKTPLEGAVYCGVREFSFEEGFIGIPGHLADMAGLSPGNQVVVEFVHLDKGEFAQLQMLSEQQNVGNLRNLLESHMRSQLTVLYLGETISVPVGGIDAPVRFTVSSLEPADAVDVINTDLTVDIVHNNNGLVSQEDEALVLDIDGPSKEISVGCESTVVLRMHVPAQTSSVDVVLECKSGEDASLVASQLLRNVGILDNSWYDYSAPSHTKKTLRVEHAQLPSGSCDVYIGIVGFSQPVCSATIRALANQPLDYTEDGSNDVIPTDTKVCANCNASVPQLRLEAHRLFCERNNVKCAYCGAVFKRGSAELDAHWHCSVCNMAGTKTDEAKHTKFYHTPKDCSCGQGFGSMVELAEHRRTNCPERLIECRYCHILVAQGAEGPVEARLLEMREHEWGCGSRSISCAKCKKYVRLQHVAVHMQMHEMQERERRATMAMCSNKECGRERNNGNPLGLCSVCFGPLYASGYDPDYQKLLKRLTRTLFAQLTVGCGKSRCHNRDCATGVGNVVAGGQRLSQSEAAAKIVPVIKAFAPLSTSARVKIEYDNIDLHLCT
ncbi:hypothetical protein GGI25_004980 [Coemansia spiralis]|uniref:Ubiquitin-protein ligase E3A N-terminal zinc-binding domain-containing protein n=2 Tax=Coemansia TaxID=4863 RepID=A0A9W8G3S8_9FUNG|nr:hypothetical protein EDC05_004862 [Coemansia umbellata]KAJ2620114.1 hypothetical protein GGI26_005286 [Coemansia sp. RSA 1358]KAJ2672785.1 hypothetical protein GGI25_004980 [Coemansia spiralis]